MADETFTQMRATSGWSIPSHASMFTGKLPHQHGIHTHNRDYSSIDSSKTLPGRFPSHYSICVTSNPYVGPRNNFDSWFDECSLVRPDSQIRFDAGISPDDLPEAVRTYQNYLRRSLTSNAPIRSVLNGALWKFSIYSWLFERRPWPEIKDNGTAKSLKIATERIAETETGDSPVLMFVNLMEAHRPMYHHLGLDSDMHSAPNRWTTVDGPLSKEICDQIDQFDDFCRMYEELYCASIDYIDRLVSNWINEINRLTENETTFIITSDHGENLGRIAGDDLFDHHSSLSESILNVPFCILNSPISFAELRNEMINHLSFIDIFETITHENSFTRTDITYPLRAEVIGNTGTWGADSYWDRLIRCVYQDGQKLVWDSLGNIERITVPEGTTIHRSAGNSPTPDLPPEDTEFFDEDILLAKRNALDTNRTLNSSMENVESQLENLGYH